jgi:hypothetical protein
MALTDINSEDRLVQKTFADHLEKVLGWESVYAYKPETFGPTGTLGRESEREVVLVSWSATATVPATARSPASGIISSSGSVTRKTPGGGWTPHSMAIAATVGAPFAVLVAEELFALGCRALVSISSAGLVAERFTPPFFLLIDRALRDEGTSCHYLPPGRYADADPSLVAAALEAALEHAERERIRKSIKNP